MDPEMYQGLLDITHLRYRLMPYLYSQNWKITNQGYTLMRALPMDFPDDGKVHNISDAFMFGPAFLVHPVTRPIVSHEELRAVEAWLRVTIFWAAGLQVAPSSESFNRARLWFVPRVDPGRAPCSVRGRHRRTASR